MTPTLISLWKTLLLYSNAFMTSRDFMHSDLLGCDVVTFEEDRWNIYKDLSTIKETVHIGR